MSRVLLLFFAVFFFSPAFTAKAGNYEVVQDFISEPGEGMDQFLVRISSDLAAYTAKTKWEACGMVALNENTQRWGLRLTTSKGSFNCDIHKKELPEGMRSMAMTIHTHPQEKSLFPTQFDVMASGGTWRRSQARGLGLEVFSQGDFDSGSGYVVTHGKLFYQQGPTEIREVGTVGNPIPTAIASN